MMNGEEAPAAAVVVIGASRGIGRAIARVAAAERRTVVLVARSLENLADAANDVRGAGGVPYILGLDLLSPDATTHLKDYLSANRLVCDVLVNSAGYGLRGSATTLPIKEQLGMIDVNIKALTELTLHFLPAMLARKHGGVINLASIASFTPGPNMAIYYASKSYVRSFSEALYTELRHTGVTVTCVAPGPVATEFLDRAGISRVALFNILPRLTPEYVAECAWRGFRFRRRLVIPGISARLTAFATSILPSGILLPLIGRLQRRRDDVCPCGSGLRIGKCCERRQQP
jgi:short-subunit dehydrogenase